MRAFYLVFLCFCLPFVALGQKKDYQLPEDYASAMSQKDYRMVVDLSLEQINSRYKADRVEGGTIYLAEGQGLGAINLHNLIGKCAAETNKKNWPEVIKGHFAQLFAGLDEEKKIDPTNYAGIKKYLSLRIYPLAAVQKRGGTDNLVTKTDLEGTLTVLMLDLPGVFSAVQPEAFALWRQEMAEVFKVAQANVNQQPVEKLSQKFAAPKDSIEISFVGNEDYAASYVLDLANNAPELLGEWGAVVAVPNKGLANVCKVGKANPVDFVLFIQMTRSYIEQLYREHPQPISDQFFWYYQGQFTRIEVKTGPDGQTQVFAPMGLSVLMAGEKKD
jgi:hypothetical protein